MQHLIDLIDRWQTRRVLVVGDFMLDHLVYGDAERLSPDAPVPVLAVEREVHQPGGASNVAMDLAALRCEVVCIGVTGDDATRDILIRKLQEAGCQTHGLVADADRPTTVKRSYIGLAQHRHPQKMFRADFESTEPLADAVRDELINRLAEALESADVLCVEDYNKGVCCDTVCAEAIRLAADAGVPVLVDPAAIKDYTKYRGATAVTPNRTEAALATGLPTDTPDDLERLARTMLEAIELDTVVLTLDKSGALLARHGEDSLHIPTVARSVYDVTGAGDMVLAMLAAARANGVDWPDAVRLANVAAGLEVEKFGVVPIPLSEIHLALLVEHHRTAGTPGKVRTLDQLVPEIEAYRKQGRRIAFTNGCFDIVHAGHIEVLRGARATADLLVLAVNSDASIAALKGPDRPIVPEAERVKLLAELECVDYVILFGDGSGGEADTPIPLLGAIKPDVLVKGGTYAHDQVVGWETVEQYGGKVVTIPPVPGLSTTQIVERIRAAKD